MSLRRPRRSAGSSALVRSAGPATFVRYTRAMVSGSSERTDPSPAAMPALLIRTSTGLSSDPAKTSNVSGRSTSRCSTVAPARAASPALPGSRTAATTSSPRARSCRTNSAPSPRDAPVTRYLELMTPSLSAGASRYNRRRFRDRAHTFWLCVQGGGVGGADVRRDLAERGAPEVELALETESGLLALGVCGQPCRGEGGRRALAGEEGHQDAPLHRMRDDADARERP